MTEAALFEAYRGIDGYATDCECGGEIKAADAADIAEAVLIHNESTVHQQWREWQEAVRALQRPTTRPCPCHRVNHPNDAA